MQFEPSGDHCPLCMGTVLASRIVTASDAPDGRTMTVLECASCAFAWQWPLVRTANDSVSYFQGSYADAEQGSYFDTSSKRQIAAQEFGFVRSLTSRPGKLLDVGSGQGVFCEVAFEGGWTAYGLDPAGPVKSMEATDRSLRLLNCGVGDMEGSETFDVVTMWDVIEHVEKPLDVIGQCKRLIAPGGWLVIETGNYQSVGRVQAGRGWWGYQHDHRWYFTPDTLQKLLKASGFADLRLCGHTLRPWAPNLGDYSGPSRSSLLKACASRPWKAPEHVAKFQKLSRLARKCPASANLEIFALAARKPA